MTADICDYEQLVSGRWDGGMFSAFYSWANKLGISAALLVGGFLLNLTGFQAKPTLPSTRTITWLRITDILVPLAALSVTVVLFRWYAVDDGTNRRSGAVRP